MDLFLESELAFGNTHFLPRQQQVIKINSDIPVKTLTLAEVPPSAGSFATIGDGLHHRFIIWRADASNLLLDEFAVDRDLVDPSLCINFSQSSIIPGTQIFLIRRGILLLVVPTQSGIHRFYVRLKRHQDDTLGNFSLISRLHESGELYASHDFHSWRCNSIATKAAINTDKDGLTVAAVCMTDLQLLKVIFPSLSSHSIPEESFVQGTGVLNRLFMKQNIGTLDMAIASDGDGCLRIFNVAEDGKIRAFESRSNLVILCVNLTDLIPKGLGQIEGVRLKTTSLKARKADCLLIHLLVTNCSYFVLLEQIDDKLAVIFSTNLESRDIQDFACTSQGPTNEFCLWAIVNESPDQFDEEQIQPYTLKRCKFAINSTCLQSAWEMVGPATRTFASIDKLLFDYPRTESLKNRIFDGNCFTFDVVNRAVQVVCKQPKRQFEYGNWIALSRYLDEFLSSGQFKQLYLMDKDGDDAALDYAVLRDDAKLRTAYETFWAHLMRTCSQFQEEGLKPLALWSAPSPGLIGVIQLCRFTVFSPPNDRLRAICTPQNMFIKQLFDIIQSGEMKKYLKDPDRTLEIINNNTDELCRLIKTFVAHIVPDVSSKLSRCNSPHLNSPFTIGLVATILRHQILSNLRLASLLNDLIGLVPQILAISAEARVNPKLDMVISENNSRILQIINCYATMWISLSVRLVSQDRIPKQINVAQAYLRYGSPSIVERRFSPENSPSTRQNHWEQQEEEEEDGDNNDLEEVQMDGEGEEGGGHYRAIKRVGEELEGGGGLPDPRSTTRFNEFVGQLVHGTLNSLWPESRLFALPRFMADLRFFDVLKSYCELSKTSAPEFTNVLRFFTAIALSGQNKPEMAWEVFKEVVAGIVQRDKVLNELLCRIYPSPSTLLSPSGTHIMQVDGNRKHTLVEYFNKVMLVFEEHKHTEFVIMAGERAIESAKEGDGLLLSEIYTTLFAQHLKVDNYPDSLRSVLSNPNPQRRTVCLRQLVTNLLDTRQTQILVALPYGQLSDVVVEILESRCKVDAPRDGVESMYDIAYAFHVSRCEYGRAAKLMFELSIRLRKEIQTRSFLQRRCNALATVYQTMQIAELCDEEIICELEEMMLEEEDGEGMGDWVEEDRADIGGGGGQQHSQSGSTEVRKQFKLEKGHVAKELLKTEARMALLDADPVTIPPLGEEDICRESLKHKSYDLAWLLIKEFNMKPYSLLEKITEEAIRFDFTSTNLENESAELIVSHPLNSEPDWVVCNRRFIADAGSGGSQKPHWRIVISYLDLARKIWPHDTSVLRVMANTFLKFSLKLPGWLQDRYARHHFGDLLRLLMDYDDLEDAFQLLLENIELAKRQLKEIVTKHICQRPLAKLGPEGLDTLLPYTHIEELLHMAERDTTRELPIAETIVRMQEFCNYQKALARNPIG